MLRDARDPLPPPQHVFIAGAQKSGTSSLFQRLICHPDVSAARNPADGQPVKEVKFFDNFWDRGIDWYRAHFARSAPVDLDASPNYLCARHAHQRMHDHFPEAKLIVTLRHPVDRAFSQYNHYVQVLPKSLSWDWRKPGESFEENLRAEMEEPKRRWYGLIQRGFYIEQLEHLCSFYDRDQILVTIMDQWIRDPEPTLTRMLDFLGLERCALKNYVAHMRPYTVEPLHEATRQKLEEIYAPYNERLFEWLGAEIEEWR